MTHESLTQVKLAEPLDKPTEWWEYRWAVDADGCLWVRPDVSLDHWFPVTIDINTDERLDEQELSEMYGPLTGINFEQYSA